MIARGLLQPRAAAAVHTAAARCSQVIAGRFLHAAHRTCVAAAAEQQAANEVTMAQKASPEGVAAMAGDYKPIAEVSDALMWLVWIVCCLGCLFLACMNSGIGEKLSGSPLPTWEGVCDPARQLPPVAQQSWQRFAAETG
jgi:hypothetical protein